MVTKTLYLAWQDVRGEEHSSGSRLWFPVGRLDVDDEGPFRFRYTQGAKEANRENGFPALLEFPDLVGDYRSPELFPLFQNRIITPNRPDFTDYLRALDLGKEADPIEILSANGGRRATDTFEVFPKLVKGDDGSFVCRFFLHGWRHVSLAAQERLTALQAKESLYIALELNNPVDEMALQVQTTDYHMIGWAPRYLVDDLVMAMTESPGEYSARVVRVNPMPVPSSQRVLIELRGKWSEHEPMSGEDYRPLAGEP